MQALCVGLLGYITAAAYNGKTQYEPLIKALRVVLGAVVLFAPALTRCGGLRQGLPRL